MLFDGAPCREDTAPEMRPPWGTRDRFLQVTSEENTPEAPAPAPSARRLIAPGAQAVRFADAHRVPGGGPPTGPSGGPHGDLSPPLGGTPCVPREQEQAVFLKPV